MAKIVKGMINEDGSITIGKGFKCIRAYGEGTYIIEFDEPFSEPPIVVCTIVGSDWSSYNLSASVIGFDSGYAIISTSSTDSPRYAAFNFIAMSD